ncbi:MAG: glutamyl-tRNA reductase [bacterium]|nr:glutamyl-tRNA reductase [bacterium]
MRIAVVGCNHHSAPVHVRERMAFGAGPASDALEDFVQRYPDSEAVLLSTCNRTELYIARPLHGAPRLPESVQWLARQRSLPPEEISAHLYHYEQSEAVEHLFRVVSSLDSMVLGESQILGQTKQALALAEERSAVRSLLGPLFRKAFSVAKELHQTTAIGEGHLSVGSVALDFAGQIFSSFTDKTALMIGAGEMGELTLAHLLTKNPKRVWVTNRTWARAEELAEKHHAEAKPFENLIEWVASADIVIASVGVSEPLLTKSQLQHVPAARRFRPLLLLDLGIPRNLAPELSELESFFLYNIDDLQRVGDEHRRGRQRSIAQGERVIEAHVAEFFQDRARREVGPTVAALRGQIQEIMQREYEWATPKLKSADEPDRKVIEQMLHRAVNKILHTPTRVINNKASEGRAQIYADALKRLFDLPDQQ